MLKVREVITLKGWLENSGWSYETDYEDHIIEIPEDDVSNAEYEWDWVEPGQPNGEEDTQIVVKWYPEDCGDPDDAEPIAIFSKWMSEIWEEENAE